MKYLIYFLFITICIFSIFAAPNNNEFDSSLSVDWENNIINLKISKPLNNSSNFLPKEKHRIEKEMENQLNSILYSHINTIQYDSFNNVKETLEINESLVNFYTLFNKAKIKKYSTLSKDLKSITVFYQAPIIPDIISVFINHKNTSDIPKTLLWEPSANFSGILIYAKDELPVHGENRSAKLKPCIFPKIFDEDMNLVYEYTMLDPKQLKKTGSIHYSENIKTKDKIVGINPLAITAYKIFGENNTDIIITKKAALKILNNSNNRKLLYEGKILIVCDLKNY